MSQLRAMIPAMFKQMTFIVLYIDYKAGLVTVKKDESHNITVPLSCSVLVYNTGLLDNTKWNDLTPEVQEINKKRGLFPINFQGFAINEYDMLGVFQGEKMIQEVMVIKYRDDFYIEYDNGKRSEETLKIHLEMASETGYSYRILTTAIQI